MAMEEVGGNMINTVIVVYRNRHEVEFNWSYMKMGQKFCLWVGSGAWGGYGAVYTFALYLTWGYQHLGDAHEIVIYRLQNHKSSSCGS